MRDRTMWEMLYSTGTRVAKILGLNVGDVDLAAATAIVTDKGNKSARCLSLITRTQPCG